MLEVRTPKQTKLLRFTWRRCGIRIVDWQVRLMDCWGYRYQCAFISTRPVCSLWEGSGLNNGNSNGCIFSPITEKLKSLLRINSCGRNGGNNYLMKVWLTQAVFRLINLFHHGTHRAVSQEASYLHTVPIHLRYLTISMTLNLFCADSYCSSASSPASTEQLDDLISKSKDRA